MNIKHFELVTTYERLRRDGKTDLPKQGIASASYKVDLDAIKTKLGRFLAEATSTTRFDDDASRVNLVYDRTEFELHVREWAENLIRSSRLPSDIFFADAAAKLAKLQDLQRVYGSFMQSLRCDKYQWPVFGSRDFDGTPEEYFDDCARQIRKLPAVIAGAGLMNERPHDSVLQTMIDGRGLMVLKSWDVQCKG